ncbi:MAG: peptide ABC transporter ATP-binding protein, partial [Treponema sp.]|nr:peptide ABC transporter ATP-binding protein [Treponema sp.]
GLTRQFGTAVILITHSLGVVAGMCDTIYVMYAGRIVERGFTADIFENPRHPYTRGLIKSVPRLDLPNSERLFSIPGQPPNVIDLPSCCPFFPRCSEVQEICKTGYPEEAGYGNSHWASCWRNL